MHGKYYLTEEIKPNIDLLGNVAHTNDDVMFDWQAFEIPKGTACVKSFMFKITGTNGAAQSKNFDVFFAKSIDGVAPSSLGTANAGKSAIKSAAARPYIIAHHGVDASLVEDGLDSLVAYNVLGNGKPETDYSLTQAPIFIEGEDNFPGDSNHSATTPGYQTIFVAVTTTTHDFGTGVALNQAGHQAISTSAVDLIVTGTNANNVFAIGDELVSFVASDGSTPKQIGTVTSIPDADSIVVDAVAEAFNHTTEICNRNPFRFRFGVEY